MASFQSQKIPHKAVKQRGMIIPKPKLHRAPIVFVQSILNIGFLTHQYIMPNKISVGQIESCRVQTFKKELGFIVASIKWCIYNSKFLNPMIKSVLTTQTGR